MLQGQQKNEEGKNDDPTGIIKQAKKLCSYSNVDETINKSREKYKKILSIFYFLFCEFNQFCMYKTYYDETWKEIWIKTYTLGGIFKNLCENNSIYFKSYLGRFIPQLRSVADFNTGKRNLVFEYYVRVESFVNSYLGWLSTENRITMNDRPELLLCRIRLFQILNEFVNGPCPLNQRQIYRYRTDSLMGVLRRNINDVNSVFYNLMDITLDYITALIEGEGVMELESDVPQRENKYLITNYMASNTTPRMLYEMIFNLLKRLSLYRKMAINPSFRSYIIGKVKKKRENHQKEMLKSGGLSSQIIEKEILKNKSLDTIFTAYEDQESTVTKEMMEVYDFTEYQDIYDLYKKDPQFSDHIFLKICIKVYSYMEQLGRNSNSMRLFLKTKKIRISNYYGEEVDMDDKVLTKNILRKQKSLGNQSLTEDMVFFMFILKISKKIEISVKLPTMSERFLKLVYFPILPPTLYLEEKTKMDLISTIDLKDRRGNFQKSFEKLFMEMDDNYQFSLNNRFFYLISKNDTFYRLKLFCWVVGLYINILCLIYYELNELEDDLSDKDNRKLFAVQHKLLINLSSYIFAGISGIFLLVWVLFRSKTVYKLRKFDFEHENIYEDSSTLRNKIYLAVSKTFSSDPSAVNFTGHLIFALLGVFVSPFFHTLHLLLVINISETAEYVYNASVAHINQLGVTLLLAVFLIYSFSVLNADYYSGHFDNDDIDICKTLRSCTIYVLNLGLRNGGGIGDSMKLYPAGNKLIGKTILDLMFFFLINVISLNIVFGIIIDTFGELRGNAESRGKYF